MSKALELLEQPGMGYSVNEGSSNYDRFLEIYTKKLIEQIKKNPDDYMDTVETAPTLAKKMTDAFKRGSANINSNAFKAACRALKIKPTRKDSVAFLNA